MTYQLRRPTEMMMQVYTESVSDHAGRHVSATPRLDVEELVRLANRVFEATLELDLSLHESDEVTAYPAIAEVIPGLYRAWVSSTRDLQAIIGRVESRGMTIRGSEDLDTNLQVVSTILPDREEQISDLVAATGEVAA